MASIRPLAFSFLLSLAAASAQVPPSSALTLQSALNLAEMMNLDVRISRENVNQATEFANQTRVGLLPNISASAQQTRTDAVNITGNVVTDSPLTNRFDARLSGSAAILNPNTIAAYQFARAGITVAQADLLATLQASLATVAQTYFAQLHDVRRIAVLDDNTTRARALLELAQNQMTAGIATRIDVTRAQSQLAIAQQARLQQDTVVYQSALQLQRLLSIDPSQPLHLADFNVQRQDAGMPAGIERTIFERRPDWLRAEKAVEQAKLDVRTARSERLPALGVAGQYGYAAPNISDSNQKEEWFAGATLSVPVFDGLRSSADRRAALSRQRQQEFRLQNLEVQIGAEVRLAAQDAASRYRQIAVAETNLRLAQEQLELARERYQKGVADNQEVVDAQNNLAIASDGMNDAIYQYNVSRVELARSRGDVRSVLTEQAP